MALYNWAESTTGLRREMEHIGMVETVSWLSTSVAEFNMQMLCKH